MVARRVVDCLRFVDGESMATRATIEPISQHGIGRGVSVNTARKGVHNAIPKRHAVPHRRIGRLRFGSRESLSLRPPQVIRGGRVSRENAGNESVRAPD